MSLKGVLSPLFPDMAFFAPNGPTHTPMGMGYQWFSDNNWTFKDYDGMTKTHAMLTAYIEENIVKGQGIPWENIMLFGFSQGTMMSLFSAPRFEKPVAGVLGFSGKMMWEEKLDGTYPKPPITLIHGLEDDVVPHEMSSKSAQALKALGFDVTLTKEASVAHYIGQEGMQEAVRFLKKHLK